MPLPKIAEGETPEVFQARCMADEYLVTELPDEDQRIAVCVIMGGVAPEAEPEPASAPAPAAPAEADLSREEPVLLVRSIDIAGDTGGFEGYAATWDYKDDGYQYQRGAFAKTIHDRQSKVPLLIAHANQGGAGIFKTVGFLTDMKEDDVGLWVRAEFLDNELARATREMMKIGGVKAMSVGTRPLQFERVDTIFLVREAKLVEVTLTNVPADHKAEVMNVRSEEAVVPTTLPVTPEPPVITDTLEAVAERKRRMTILEIGE